MELALCLGAMAIIILAIYCGRSITMFDKKTKVINELIEMRKNESNDISNS